MSSAAFIDHLRECAEKRTRPVPQMANALVGAVASGECGKDLHDSMIAWLVEQAPSLVGRELRKMTPPAERQRTAPTTTVERFQVAAGNGDLDALSDFGLVYRVGDVDKCLGDLTGADHRVVARGFQTIGESSLMLSAVHRQIAKLLEQRPGTKTSDVMKPEQYRSLLERLAPSLAGLPPG